MRRVSVVSLFTLACAANQPAEPPPPETSAKPSCERPETFGEPGGSAADTARRFTEACGLAATSSLTATLVSFPTVRAREGKTGPSFVRMRRYLEGWSKARGFTFESFDDDPWVISWGDGDPSVAFVMHADVVPVLEDVKAERPRIPPGWTVPPFEVTTKDGRLYGRGTEDDKAPIASVLFAMETLSRLGYQPNGRILAILGTGEEHDWEGMVAYAKSQPHAKYVVSIDASYPVVIGEAGFVAWRLEAPLSPKTERTRKRRRRSCTRVVDAKAGQFLTQVPGEAMLVLDGRPKNLDAIAAEISKRADIRHEIETNGKHTTLKLFGKAVHSSVAPEGQNALWALGAASKKLELCPGGIRDLLHTVDRYFDQDHHGVKLGVAYEHEVMGKLLVAPTMLRAEDGKATLSINMRRPEGKDVEAFNGMLDTALSRITREVSTAIAEKNEGRYVGKPAMAPPNGPLVSTLLDIYAKASGVTDPKPLTIRGGTYSRLFPGAVNFGPALPDHEYRGHAPDEYIEVKALELMNETVLEALVRLDGSIKAK